MNGKNSNSIDSVSTPYYSNGVTLPSDCDML